MPHVYHPGVRLPVIMFLNGKGENGGDGVRQISNNFGQQIWEMQEHFPFLAIATQCGPQGEWTPESIDTQRALRVLDDVIREFGADEDRIYLTGVSSGGTGAWRIAAAFPHRFAAVVPLCGQPGVAEAVKIAEAQLPVWNFFNSGDNSSTVESNRLARQQLIESGVSPVFVEYDEWGHDCWNRGYRCTAMYRWLLEQRLSHRAQPRRFESLPPETLLDEWRHEESGTWTTGEESCLEGHGESDGIPGMLVSKCLGTAFELHGDVWLEPSLAVGLRVLEETGGESQQGFTVSIVLPEDGTGGASTVGGEFLARLDPAAQRSLNASAWNDVRIRVEEGRLVVQLHGMPAVDIQLPNVREGKGYRVALELPDREQTIRWRLLRMRCSDHPPVTRSGIPWKRILHVWGLGSPVGDRGVSQARRFSKIPSNRAEHA